MMPGRCRGAPLLLYDLISPCEQRGRHIEPEGLRGLQVDHQLVFSRRLHREVGGPGSDMPQQHALASFWRAWGYATRQDALFLIFHHRFSSRHYVVFGSVDAVFGQFSSVQQELLDIYYSRLMLR